MTKHDQVAAISWRRERVRVGDVVWSTNIIGERLRCLRVRSVECGRFNAAAEDGWNDWYRHDREDVAWVRNPQ